MKRYQLAIVVREKEYIRRVADYMRESSFGESWQVSAFTQPNACKQFAKQGYQIDLIVAEPELIRELQPELAHIPAITLVRKLGETGGQHEVLQFQALSQLLKAISEQFEGWQGSEERLSRSLGSGEGAKVVTIHSASGRVGKTTLALHLAHAAGARGLRTFYLNLERWNSSSLWLKDEGEEIGTGEGLSELLYAIKTGSKSNAKWLSEQRKYLPGLKFDCLPGFRNAEDRQSLCAEDVVAIIEIIKLSGYYDWVIVDMDDGIEEMHISILEQSDYNFWIISEEPAVIAKQAQMMSYGHQKWGERFARIVAKSEVIRNRDEGNKGALRVQLNATMSVVVIPEVKEWRRGEHHSLLSSPSYRAAADRLFVHMTGERGEAHAVG